ncbi:MAG TPA: hypothetical protein VGP79_15210 [Bryobacteraceae bacterium]|jgi:DNA-binding beta-propeller fold protein YncE|nr:hypothetical protein [Bryobacteraceae bacterium]
MRPFLILFSLFAFLSVLVADPATSKVYIFPGPNGEIFVIDAKTASVSGTINVPGGLYCGAAAFSPDGTRMFCSTTGATAVIDLTTHAVVDSIPFGGSNLGAIDIAPDGSRAWILDQDLSSLLAVSLPSKQVLGTVPLTGTAVRVSYDGTRVYVADGAEAGRVFVIDAVNFSILSTVSVGQFPDALRFSPDGTELWVVFTGGAKVIDPVTNTVIATIQLPYPFSLGSVTEVTFHPSNRWAYFAQGGEAGWGAGPIVIDRASKQVKDFLVTMEQTFGIGVTADGSRGFTANIGNGNGTATVLDTNGNSVIGSIPLGGFLLHALARQSPRPAIQPSACVKRNNDGTYTARFSYENSSDRELLLPVGPSNLFSPGPADRGQPTLFTPGGQNNAFSIVFDGSPVTWSVQTPFALTGSLTVSANSQGCQSQ